MAWLYRQRAESRSGAGLWASGGAGPADRRGLWVDPEPVEPWESRAEARTAQGGKKDWNATRLCNVWPR